MLTYQKKNNMKDKRLMCILNKAKICFFSVV